jgi:hypothetical protein
VHQRARICRPGTHLTTRRINTGRTSRASAHVLHPHGQWASCRSSPCGSSRVRRGDQGRERDLWRHDVCNNGSRAKIMNYNNIKSDRAFAVDNTLVYYSCPGVLLPVADIAHYQYTFFCIRPDQMALIYIHAMQSPLYMPQDSIQPILLQHCSIDYRH